MRLFNSEQLSEALATLEKLPISYKDTEDLCPYYNAYAVFEAGDYEVAAQKFEELGGYKNAADYESS